MEHKLYCSKIYCKETIAIRSIIFFFFLVPEMKEKNKKPFHKLLIVESMIVKTKNYYML